MQVTFQGRITIGEPGLNVDLRDLEIGVFGGQVTLYATNGPGGGLTSFALNPWGGLAQLTGASLFGENSPLGTGGFLEFILVDGQAQVLYGTPDGLGSQGVGAGGALTGALSPFNLIGGNLSTVSDVVYASPGGTDLLLVADGERGRINTFLQRPDGTYEIRDAVAVGKGAADLAVADFGGSTVVVSMDMNAGAVVTHVVNGFGRFVTGDTAGAAEGLGITMPTALEVVEAHGTTWVVLGAAGTGSLSVMALDATGTLTPTDHAIDTLHTRFGGVQDIATVSAGGWSFVIAGGADDGLSLFTLTPAGKLIHLDTIVQGFENGVSNGLGNVEAISATVLNGMIQIFVTSGLEGGISQFSVPLDGLGAVVSGAGALAGTVGDDLLISGADTTWLTGGAGADIFALGYHDHILRITDFTPGEDRIDLSAMPLLYDASRLIVTEQPGGIVLEYGFWRVEISSFNGQTLSLEDVFDGPFDWATHLPIIPDVIDDGPEVLPPPPPPAPGDPVPWHLPQRFEGSSGDANLAQNGAAMPDLSPFSGLEYIASYGDLMAILGANAQAGFNHYIAQGAAEGRSISFDGLQYIASHGDLIVAFGVNADAGAAHYITQGAAEGRGMSFSALEYIASHADLSAAFGANADAGAAHYIQAGFAEGRGTTFSGLEYIASYADLRAAFGANADAGAAHYLQYGMSHGLTADFDGLEYIASHGDLIAVFGANGDAGAAHFITQGDAEGRASTFRGLEYIASHGDLIVAFGMDTQAATLHFITQGFAEGRGVSFDSIGYIASHADLIAAFGTDTQAATQHYIAQGFAEGRGVSFSGLEYIASYVDLINGLGANMEAGAAHFISYGLAEGREVSFRGLEYIASYGDLIVAFGLNAHAGAAHFITDGLDEGRSISFDGLEYIASHGDLIGAFGADVSAGVLHFITQGFAEGRGVSFDGLEYIASHADLIAAFGGDADAATLHFVTQGFAEGRAVSFGSLDYIASYVDLIAAFGANADAGAMHYIIAGQAEGRAASLRSGLETITQGLTGNEAGNLLMGSAAAELIVGLGGGDVIAGQGGDDVLAGGAGVDTFVFADGGGQDMIADFDATGSGERIDLSAVSSITDAGDLFANHLSVVNGVVRITYDGQSITLTGVDLGDLDAGDFIF